MTSAYSALLKALEDETVGAAVKEAPPLDTTTPVLEPSGAVAPVSPGIEPATPEPKPPSAAATPVEAAPTPPPSRTLADKYGVSMPEVAPFKPVSRSHLLEDIGRAGATIGAAFGGTKPDYSFYDNLEKRSDADAAGTNKAAMDAVAFKRQLFQKVADAKAAKAAANAPLDPDSQAYKASVAILESDPRLKALWDKVQTNAARLGAIANPNQLLKEYHIGQAQGHGVTLQNGQENRALGLEKFTQGLEHDDRKRAEEFERKIEKSDYEDSLQQDKLSRQTNILARAKLRDDNGNEATPTPEMTKKVIEGDANAQVAAQLLDRLLEEMSKMTPAEMKNPLQNAVVQQIHQSLLNRVRISEDFGVPSGRDMEQLARQVADPTTFAGLVKEGLNGQVGQALKSLRDNTMNTADTVAKQYGYDAYGTGGKPSEDPRERVKARLLGRNKEIYGASPSGARPAPIQTSGEKVKVVDENGKVGSIPAVAVDAWLKKNPGRKRAE